MAIKKQGMAYYSVDTDRYQDIRIKKLKKAFGTNGIAVYDFILCEIYRVKGCFLVWDESTVFDVADYFNLKESLIKEVVNYCAGVGLFSKAVLDRESVITSQSIQLRYLDACIRMKRKAVDIPEEYQIIPEESKKIPEETPITPEESAQSKVKESKVESTVRAKEGLENSNLFRQPKIPTKQQVWEAIKGAGGTKEMAKSFFEKHESTGWFINGSPIVNYIALAQRFVTNWNGRESKSPDQKSAAPPLTRL